MITTRAFPSLRTRAQCPCCYRSISVSGVADGTGTLRNHKLLTVHCDGSGTRVPVSPYTEVEVR